MNYPLISEYIDAIKSAQDNFDQLSSLQPVLDAEGNPIMSSGNFAVVFKMKDLSTNKLFAVKCFLREQDGRSESYERITSELNSINSNFLINVKYYMKELFVDSFQTNIQEFPILLMDWVDGITLDRYLRENINDSYKLRSLTYQFCQMAVWLLSQEFAHGDLKPDNILIKPDGQLVLIDYDGMYVPSMQGQLARELGSPDYRHPLRNQTTFNKNIDDFTIASIALSLKAISLKPELLNTYGGTDHLLLSESDYLNITSSEALKAIYSLSADIELDQLLGAFMISYAKNDLSQVSYNLFNLKKPLFPSDEVSTIVTDTDLKDIRIDDYGVKYSNDGLKLIEAPTDLTNYVIKDTVKVICDSAFSGCKQLSNIKLPSNLKSIGGCAFYECCNLVKVQLPSSVTHIGSHAFGDCVGLQLISIPQSILHIMNSTFMNCKSLLEVKLPSSLKSIGMYAFTNCETLKEIQIPESVNSIEYHAFRDCHNLQSINIPNNIKFLGGGFLAGCMNLKKINSQYLSQDKNYLIFNNEIVYVNPSIVNIMIPNTVTSIASGTFWRGQHKSIHIPDCVVSLGKTAFGLCKNLTTIRLPNNLLHIPYETFGGCSTIQTIKIPDNVKEIEGFAFSNCTDLITVNIPNCVHTIGKFAFNGCRSLKTIFLPYSLNEIGDYAFYGCTSLNTIYIPKGSKKYFLNMLSRYKSNKNLSAKLIETI